MSGKSKRRPVRPHERAKVDQVMAGLRDHAVADPHTLVIGMQYADPGKQCCWCDCPDEDHSVPGYRCAGCPEEAVFVANIMPPKPDQQVYPLCERHRWDYVEYWTRMGVGMGPNVVVGYDGYDNDIEDDPDRKGFHAS